MNTSCVYFVAAPGRIKIGFTTKPERRLVELQSADMEPLSMLHIIAGSLKLERRLHELAANWRIRREWFQDCPEVRAIIARAVAGEILVDPVKAQEMTTTRQQAATLVEREWRKTRSKMRAYEAVAENIGTSADWIRKFVNGYIEMEPKMTVYKRIVAQATGAEI